MLENGRAHFSHRKLNRNVAPQSQHCTMPKRQRSTNTFTYSFGTHFHPAQLKKSASNSTQANRFEGFRVFYLV